MSNAAIDRVTSTLGPITPIAGEEVFWTLADRLKHYKIPGISVAVIDGGAVVWARGFGAAEIAGRPVTDNTLFQACSMSKPVAALAIMREVERGGFDLGRPVNEYLSAWRVPDSELSRGEAVTLARLLSHTAGLSVPGFPGYSEGVPLPTIPQVLDGVPPANTAPVRVIISPGTKEAYSGGGTTVAQLALEERSGVPFAEFLTDEVLRPIGMSRSLFATELPHALKPTAASGHTTDGPIVKGRWHRYVELAAAGLWTTARDYAVFLIAMQHALGGRAGSIVSQQAADAMMTRQPNSHFGLGFELTGTGESIRFGHSGGNAGFRCDARAYCRLGKGAVVLTNGEGVDNGGWTLTQEVMGAIAREYAWPGFTRKPRTRVAVAMADLQRLVGDYEVDMGGTTAPLKVSLEDGDLISRFATMAPRILVPISALNFVSADSPYEIRFTLGTTGAAERVNVADGDQLMFVAVRNT